MTEAFEKFLATLKPNQCSAIITVPGLCQIIEQMHAKASEVDVLKKDMRIAAERIAIQSQLLARAADARVESVKVPANRLHDLYFRYSLNDSQFKYLRGNLDVRKVFIEAMIDTMPKDSFWEIGR